MDSTPYQAKSHLAVTFCLGLSMVPVPSITLGGFPVSIGEDERTPGSLNVVASLVTSK